MSTISSTVSSTASATVTTTSWWLKDPQAASRNQAISVPVWTYTEPEDTATFYPEGRDRAVVLADQIRGIEGTLSVLLDTATKFTAFKLLRSGQRTLLVQSDMTDQWYVRLGRDMTVRLENAINRTTAPLRRVTVPFVEVDEP